MVISYPVDVVKSKIQTDGFSEGERQYKGIIDCVRKTFCKEGINGFFKGFGICILRADPVNASIYFCGIQNCDEGGSLINYKKIIMCMYLYHKYII